MPLDPSLNVTGDPGFVKVSASDVAGSPECGRARQFQTRRQSRHTVALARRAVGRRGADKDGSTGFSGRPIGELLHPVAPR